jgi:hypothetical protein
VTARLAVRVRPGARRPGLRGRLADGTWQVAVSAPPEGGRANAALVEVLAEALGVRTRQVTVARGATSRAKQVEIEGLAADEVERRLARALDGERSARGE